MTTGATLSEALASGRGTERPFRCHVHDDSNASASVNVLKGVWTCYACGAHGAVDGVDLIPEAKELLEILKGDYPVRVLPEAWLDLFDAHESSPYWAGRFGDGIATRYRCGTHPVSGLPTYPIRNAAGQPLGVVVRSDEHPKYKYPYGVSTSRTFFGELRPAPVVVLVEGAADVMAIATGGIPSDWSVLGCYGAGLHKPQRDLLASLNPYIVVAAFDDDDAGRSAMNRAEASIADIAPCVSYLWGSIGANDPGDLPHGTALEALREHIAGTPYKRFA